MSENKFCPLLSITSEDSLTDCYGELCAWYTPPVCAPNGRHMMEGRCSVQCLGALPELVKGVRSL